MRDGVPRVSIVTPCLNPGAWLVRCLDSVAAQTYPEIEHVVVDGGSTDGTVALAQSRGVRVISEPDRGQTDALNKGFALATGDYLGWLNADDWLVPNAVERVVETFARTPEVGWVYCDCTIRREGRVDEVVRAPARLDRKTFEYGDRLTQPGTFVARWALDRVGPLDDEIHLAMDFDLWLRLLDAGIPAAYIPEALAVFEIHRASKTGRVGLSEFYREESLALLKSGRRRQAAAGLGRAAAAAAQTGDERVDADRLPETIGRFQDMAIEWGLETERRVVRAAAFAEAARLELQVSLRGLRHLARPTPWLSRTSLEMIGRAAVRWARRR
jgi:GT2 family glycosyltransferase